MSDISDTVLTGWWLPISCSLMAEFSSNSKSKVDTTLTRQDAHTTTMDSYPVKGSTSALYRLFVSRTGIAEVSRTCRKYVSLLGMALESAFSKRFGNEGFKVALLARTASKLDAAVAGVYTWAVATALPTSLIVRFNSSSLNI